MASQTVYDAIRAHLDANWSNNSGNPPLTYENEEFSPPVNDHGAQSPWIAVEMTGTFYGQQSIGEPIQSHNRWDEEGTLWFHVFVRSGSGSQAARGYAKSLVNLFRGVTLLSGNLDFGDASIGLGEAGDENGNFYRISVNIDWRFMDA